MAKTTIGFAAALIILGLLSWILPACSSSDLYVGHCRLVTKSVTYRHIWRRAARCYRIAVINDSVSIVLPRAADKVIHNGSPSQVSTAPEIFVLLLFIKNTVSAWATGTNVGDRLAMARD